MNKIISYAAILICLIPLFSACKFLAVDDYFNETLKMDSVFSKKMNVEKYLGGGSSLFSRGRKYLGRFLYSRSYGNPMKLFQLALLTMGCRFVLGEVSPTDAQGMDIWGTMFKIIRKANTLMARMDEAKDMTTIDKRDLLGYVYFLRGYAYYHLLMQYGPVVILGDDVLESNESIDYYARSRSTYDESVDYICDNFEEAAKYLPNEVAVNLFGRPTRGAGAGLDCPPQTATGQSLVQRTKCGKKPILEAGPGHLTVFIMYRRPMMRNVGPWRHRLQSES